MENQTIKLALVDDHILLRNALASLVNSFDDCEVVHESNNGSEFVEKLSRAPEPDIVLLDLNMPEKDGYETAVWLQEHRPGMYVLMVTMYDSDLLLIRLLQAGVRGFMKKDMPPSELRYAIHSLVKSGYYYSTQTAGKLANLFRANARDNLRLQNSLLSEEEIEFLKLTCSDLTYKEIAQQLRLTPRTIDVLRDQLFLKLDVKSRVGLAMVALKNGLTC
jgi:two-component system invasion response regulator UvrY